MSGADGSTLIDSDVTEGLSQPWPRRDTGRMTDPNTVVESLEEFALSFPEAWPDAPWGDRVVKVGKKIFVFLSRHDATRPSATFKLPDSRDHALSYPDAFPTGYGLGRHGWVTVLVDEVPTEEQEVLFDFVEESYRAVATKTLVRRLDAERDHEHETAADTDG